jgi:poly-gamma-glutamate capsule biosynthesis protein CapA/YwtB (metallophosphatase superfamily)
MVNKSISLCAVGDLHPDRPNLDEIFDLVRPTLMEADITFGHLVGVISDRSALQPALGHSLKLMHPDCGSAFKNAGFKVMSCAGNHSMDYMNFLDTLEHLKKNDIVGIGLGRDIDEARKPVIFNIRGTRVGFLTCNAINNLLPFNLRAGIGKPGTAFLRIYSSYEVADTQPGVQPIVHTQADEQDLQDIIDDIQKLRSQVDVLVWSPHWGLHSVPKVLAEYETKVAHMVIDAGVDLILGHHSHILKGIEIYKGKAIFFCLGNFAFDAWRLKTSAPKSELKIPNGSHPSQRNNIGWMLTLPIIKRINIMGMTMIVKCFIAEKKIQKITVLPVMANSKWQPEPISASSREGKEIIKFLEESSEDFDTKLPIDGDEAIVIKS